MAVSSPLLILGLFCRSVLIITIPSLCWASASCTVAPGRVGPVLGLIQRKSAEQTLPAVQVRASCGDRMGFQKPSYSPLCPQRIPPKCPYQVVGQPLSAACPLHVTTKLVHRILGGPKCPPLLLHPVLKDITATCRCVSGDPSRT